MPTTAAETRAAPAVLAPLVAIAAGICGAVYLGYLIGENDTERLLEIVLAFATVCVLAFVGNYWWAPLLLISALTFRTNFLGFIMTGIDIGVVVLAILLPLKLSVRRLRFVQENPPLGRAFLALFAYTIVHAVVIILYTKYTGAMGFKNIVKAYYAVMSPLVFYALLARYCRRETIRPVVIWMFVMYTAVLVISIPVVLLNIQLPFLAFRHFMFDWTHAGVAIAALRNYAPLVFAVALAFWTSTRSVPVRLVLLMMAIIAILGALFSASRVALLVCVAEACLFCVIRRRWWLIPPILTLLAVMAAVISENPNVLYSLPTQVHRALTPFNFSEHRTEVQTAAGGSDQWHEDLRRDSYRYWTSDLQAFLFGHGFKGWDESLSYDPAWTRYYEDAKRLAVQTGRPENALNSITNIFGLVGVVLYGALLWQMAAQLFIAHRRTPPASFERSLCDSALVGLLAYVLFAPLAGGAPGLSIIYWQLGILASRHYVSAKRPGHTATESLQFGRPALA